MCFEGRFSTRSGRPGHARPHRGELKPMTSAQEAPAVASAAKVHEYTTDLVVHRRHEAADGVAALDLVDPQGDDLPAWEPGAHIDLLLDEGLVRQYSLCGDPQDVKTWRVGVLLDPASRGGSRHVHD